MKWGQTLGRRKTKKYPKSMVILPIKEINTPEKD